MFNNALEKKKKGGALKDRFQVQKEKEKFVMCLSPPKNVA